MKRFVTKVFLIVFLIQFTSHLHAQEAGLPLPVNKATLVGVGHINLYDTYLSPLEYTGWAVRVLNERTKQLSWFDKRFTSQQTIELEFASTESSAKNVNQYWLLFAYSWGGHYKLYNDEKFRFSAGAIWNTSAGVLYNERNSNNPASARAYSNINLSAIGFYRYRDFTFRWQLDTPVSGILFSPHYGQSYYEISLGNSVGVANFASLHNQRALRNYMTVDFPVDRLTLRIGYLGSFYQTKIHSLQTHTYSNSFVIGIVSESLNLSGNKLKRNKHIKSSYYFED